MGDLIRLATDGWTAVIAPSIGGAICALTYRDEPILRPTPDEVIKAGNVRSTACYPLIPYGNRIAQRRFSFAGAGYELAANFPGPHSLHGVGWRRAWRVDAADETSCALGLDHRPTVSGGEDWPFAFDARQVFSLGAAGLTVAMSVTNSGETDAPAGIGLHPFFVRRPGQRLAFNSQGAWTNGPDMLPAERLSVRPWRYAAGRMLDDTALDNDFVGWDGKALMTANEGPDIVLRASAAFGCLRVYTPPDADFFAVEPVSHRADAINHPRQAEGAMATLKPGETLSGEVGFLLDRGS